MAEPNDLYSRAPTFHNTDAGYILPNEYVPFCDFRPLLIFLYSSAEHDRLIDQHNSLVALLNDRIVHAPISSPDTVLDIGCGTGIVTRYLSTHFHAARHVYGIDLCQVPAQPSDDESSNLSFIRGDFRKLAGVDPCLQFESADFVFSRLLLDGMTDWEGYVRDVFKMLKPGCWAEMDDYVEDTFYTDNRIVPREQWEWLRSIRAGGFRKGLDLDAGLNICRYMEEAGFVDIQRWEYRVPFWKGAETGQAGARLMAEHAIGDKWGLYWHMLPKLLDGMGYGIQDIERLRMDMRRNLGEEEGKYQLFCVTIGRKPDV